MNLLRVRELIRKEFIQLFRDKRNRPLLILAPFIQLMVFGYVVSTDVRDVRVGLLDLSRTSQSRLPGITDAVVVPIPVENGRETEIAALVSGEIDVLHVKQQLSQELEPYAMPRRILIVQHIPLTKTGKYDRNAILKIIGGN